MTTINTAGRRLITGENTAGRSEFVSDAPTDVTLHVPGYIELLDLWRISRIPARFTDDDSPVGDPILSPPPGGLVARLVGIPPTGETSGVGEGAAAAVFEQMGGAEARTGGPAQHADGVVPGPGASVDLLVGVAQDVPAVPGRDECRVDRRVGQDRHVPVEDAGQLAVLVEVDIAAAEVAVDESGRDLVERQQRVQPAPNSVTPLRRQARNDLLVQDV